jgi:hypothetical protein
MATPSLTPEWFYARFPQFGNVGVDVVQAALDEASGVVGDTWVESDILPAQLLYAAHSLVIDGHGSGAEAQAALAGMTMFQSMSSGGLSLTREAGKGSVADGGVLSTTSYGRRFQQIQRRNFGGPVVATDGAA